MRDFKGILLLALAFLVCAPEVRAQVAPSGIIDSSFRVEFLFGNQSLRHSDAKSPSFTAFKTDFDPRVALLAGMVEVSPFPSMSGRLAGAISILEKSGSVWRTTGGVTPPIADGRWDVEPDVGSWEVAGLYHLWNGGGYRYSVTAGYRREVWTYRGESVGTTGGTSRDELASQIPFLGLQTAMFFPMWKARFEVLGSAFMNQKITSRLQLGSAFAEYSGTINQGGLLEFQMDGNVAVGQHVWLGLNARYTYQELRGEITANGSNIGQSSLDLSTSDNYLTVGLDLSVVF